jgi:hypothetical protein
MDLVLRIDLEYAPMVGAWYHSMLGSNLSFTSILLFKKNFWADVLNDIFLRLSSHIQRRRTTKYP